MNVEETATQANLLRIPLGKDADIEYAIEAFEVRSESEAPSESDGHADLDSGSVGEVHLSTGTHSDVKMAMSSKNIGKIQMMQKMIPNEDKDGSDTNELAVSRFNTNQTQGTLS